MSIIMQLISLLLSLFMTFSPGISFLKPVSDALHEYSVSQQAKAAITEEQLGHVATVMEKTTAAFGNITMEELADELEAKGVLDFFPFNWAPAGYDTLAAAYLYACFFSVNDGLSPGDVFQIQVNLAVEAQIVARTVYNLLIDNYMKSDALAHFYWSFSATKNFGVETARIHLTNYELAGSLMNPFMDFLEERYAAYLKQGQNSTQARWNAMIESVAYALNRRDILLEEAEEFDVWNQRFGNSTVMDLWNNERGRLAASKADSSAIPFLLFQGEWNNSTLIKGETNEDATIERRQFLFDNKRLWNPLVQS